MRKSLILSIVAMIQLLSLPAFAAQTRVYVTEINAVGAQNRDELKTTLQTLLASRLNSDQIMAVASASEADIIVSGTYVAIGKVFSIDALAKSSRGTSLARAFVQGDNQDELIPAIGKLADKLNSELAKLSAGSIPSPAHTGATHILPAAVSQPKSDFIKPERTAQQVVASEFIKPREFDQSTAGGWLSKRFEGLANLMAVGRSLADGSREIFLAEDRRVSLYHQNKELKQVSSFELKANEKIVSLDTLDSAAGTELYVTIVRNEDVNSQIWQAQGDKLIKLAENVPYFLRTAHIAGGPLKLYAQEMGRDALPYGDVYEAVRNGSAITLKNSLKLPRFGSIYTFNQFRDAAGALFTVVINPDNYLIVYNATNEELWRSNDKFGGSELFYQKEDLDNVRITGDKFRWIFLNQRLQVTSRGEVMIGKNDGFFVIGNARSYKKGAVYCMAWNGSSLEEKWHTRDTQNYMPDYFYDEGRNELMILQVVQRNTTGRGASSLSIRKVE